MDFIQHWYVFFSFLLLLHRYLCNSIFHFFSQTTLSKIRPGYFSFVANSLVMPTASITSKAPTIAPCSRFFHIIDTSFTFVTNAPCTTVILYVNWKPALRLTRPSLKTAVTDDTWSK
jgi:hypothetical protein